MDFAQKNYDSRQQAPFYQFLRLAGDGVNEVQTLTITGSPTGGTLTVTRPAGGGLAAETSGNIDWNDDAAAVKAVLDAMTNIDTVTVTGGPLPGTPVVVEFTETSGLQDQPLMTTTDSLTGGSTPASAITLTTRGIATDEHNMAIDGSSADQLFGLRPTSADVFIVSELIITIEDTGAMTPALFGFITELVKGVKLQVLDTDSAVLYDLFDGEPIKANKDLPNFFADVAVHSWGSGNEIIVGTFDLSKSGSPLAINGADSEKLVATVQDDLTGLVDMTMRVKGFRKI